ncbi:MAG: bestrophin-like domain [Candidatus Helarchaeota archaeon]
MTKDNKMFNVWFHKHPWFLFILIILTIVLSFLAFYFLIPVFRSFFDYSLVQYLGDAISIYMAFLGFVFALFISFTYQQGIERQRTVRDCIYREAKSLQNILIFTKSGASKQSKEEIFDIIRNYIKTFLAEGYKVGEKLNDEDFLKLFGIIEILKKGTVGHELEVIYEELQDMSTIRSERLAATKSGLSNSQMLVLELLGWMLVMGFWFLDINMLLLEAILFSVIAGIYTLLIYVISDVDDPFEGLWRIKLNVMEELLNKLD